jgi:hypothetical protein
VAFFDTFSRDIGQWRTWGGQSGAVVERCFDPQKKDYCVKLVNPTSSASFGTYVRTSPYDAATYPMMSFEYKIPKNAKIHLLVHLGGKYYAVRLTSKSRSYTNIGRTSIRADGQWHTTSFDLYRMLRRRLPKLKKYPVRYVCLSDYNNGNSQAGVTCFFDNFAVFSPGKHVPAFQWSSLDPTGIKAFAYSMDTKPTTAPPSSAQTTDRKKTLPALPRRGMYYLHVRAQDSAGNWGPTTHHPYYLATTPPKPKPPKRPESPSRYAGKWPAMRRVFCCSLA